MPVNKKRDFCKGIGLPDAAARLYKRRNTVWNGMHGLKKTAVSEYVVEYLYFSLI